MSGTVAERLAAELVTALDSATPRRRVLLWFDPDGSFNRLVRPASDALAPRTEVIRYELGQSQIALKLELLRREGSNAATVVYLPNQSPDVLRPAGAHGEERPILWALADYLYKGAIWVGGGESESRAITLSEWLERQGVRPSFGSRAAELFAGGADSPIARYAELHAGTDPARWPSPLRVDDVRGRLAGDPTESALLLIASPRTATVEWGERTGDVLRAIRTTFGTSGGDDAGGVAGSLVTVLALTDAWDTFGRRDDFPFLAALPQADKQRARALKLLREHVLRRQDVAPRYHAYVAELGPKWGAIGPWAKALSGQPLGMRDLALERVAALVDTLDASSPKTRAESLDRLRENAATWPADRSAWVEQMRAIGLAVELLDRISGAGELLETVHDASLLVEAYAAKGGWYAIDWGYLQLAHATATEPMLAPLRRMIDHAYVGWVASANERFAKLVEAADEWPLPGTDLTPGPEWSATAKNRRAVIVTDAMRLDVARGVTAELSDALLDVGLSTLPTTTPFGMASLLPHGGRLEASVANRKLTLRDGTSKHDLHEKGGRSDWLSETLGKAGQSVAFAELKALIEGAKSKTADLTVVFDYRLDDAGHGQGSIPDEVESHVRRLTRAIQRLHELGIGSVDVVTDHGFLHQPPELVEALGKPPVAPAQVHARAARYAVLRPDAPVDSLVRVRSPLVPTLELGFPRGIRTLEKPAEYLHGGISLQECVIGRIRSVRALGTASLRVAVRVPTTQLPTGTVAVEVSPEAAGQMTLATPPPRRLSLAVSDASGQEVSDQLACEVRWDAPSQKLALYLREGTAISAGSTLRLTVTDSDTGEGIHTEDLTLLIDWE